MKIGKGTKVWYKNKSVILKCRIGKNCIIHAPVWIGDDVIIGDNCKIQAFAFLPTGVVLGDNVFVGPGAVFTNDKRPPSHGKSWAGILVKNGAVIGANATILPRVTVGENSIVGAGAVVTKSVPNNTVVVGNPARLLTSPRGKV